MAVPNIFGTATAAIPLSQLDTNFATAITLGNTAVYLGNTTTSLGNVTLTNVTISSGNVTVSAGSNTAPSITTVGDTNTGIFFPAADTIAFAEGGVESVRIDSDGDVGIGTASPTTALSVYRGATATVVSVDGDSSAVLRATRYTTDTNPSEIVARKARGTLAAPTTVATSDIAGGVFFQAYGGTNFRNIGRIDGLVETYTSDTNIAGALAFYTNAGSTDVTERMRIDSAGNLAIGTTTNNTLDAVGAARPLVVQKSDTSTTLNGSTAAITIANGSATTNNTAQLNFAAITGASGNQYSSAIISCIFGARTNAQYPTGILTFSTSTSLNTAPSEKMRIDSSGNVGIGTTDLKAPFIVGKAATAAYGQIAAFSLTASDVSNPGMSVTKYDNVTTTSQVFTVFRINQGTAGSGQINANGVSAAAFGSFSDSRLKENIVDLPSQLANIMALRPVEYDYIASEGGGHQIGFVAQEVQAVYPDLVGEREDGMLTLTDMNKNDARLIKAIQEQQAIITALTARITALESK